MEKNKEKDIKRRVAETISEKPEILKIDVKPKSKFHAWLIRHKLSPSVHYFEIKPQRVDNIYRIAGRAVSLDVDGIIEDTDTVGVLMRTMSKHGEDLFYIVAAIIQNDHREPTQRILNIVRRDFEMKDILLVVRIGVSNYNIADFLSSIAFVTGINALKSKS